MKPLYLEVLTPITNDCRYWNPLINLKTGVIENWEIGNVASICYKVCDQGLYFLQFEKGVRALKWDNWHVPEKYLSQNEEGFGDDIIMDVDTFGKIKDWKEPEFNPNEWIGIDEKITGNDE